MSKVNQGEENTREPIAEGEKMSAFNTNPCGEGKPPISVTIQPTRFDPDCNNPQFKEVRKISEFIRSSRIDFNCYKRVMDNILNEVQQGGIQSNPPGTLRGTNIDVLCEDKLVNQTEQLKKEITGESNAMFKSGPLFRNSKAYNILKYATESYVHAQFGLDKGSIPNIDVLPYIRIVEANLGDICCCYDAKDYKPIFAELIWSYWMEEGMMVNTINAIARRFQNKRSEAGPDPLANITLDPLRPINNLIWGYIQDGIHRLGINRRAFEYDHQYGLSLFAAGQRKLNTADSRAPFIQAFHNLLYKCSIFYREADNLMKVPDAFPVLNALREVHRVLSEGADNQFGDLPVTARVEMMMEQYILSRPEIREFLGGRVMVPYDEAWMDRVDAMKSLQGWGGPSVTYFRDLAFYGEQIILSLRWISWWSVANRDFAREWALLHRDAIQRYVHSYQAVTGVDLSALETTGMVDARTAPPAYWIDRRGRRYGI